MLAKVKLHVNEVKRLKSVPKNFDVSRFSNSTIAEEFKAKIGGAFEPLLQLEDTNVENLWTKFKDNTNKITYHEVVGIKKTKQVRGLPEDLRKACQKRRKARITLMNNPIPLNKRKYTHLTQL